MGRRLQVGVRERDLRVFEAQVLAIRRVVVVEVKEVLGQFSHAFEVLQRNV